MTDEPGRRAETARFLRFCLVGGAGFLTDAAILQALVRGLHADPIAARFVSFAAAVAVTYLLNRHWSFADAAPGRGLTMFVTYLGVQGLGFACNLAIYALLVSTLPPPWNQPILCLAVASAAALLVNYGGARRLVFGASGRGER